MDTLGSLVDKITIAQQRSKYVNDEDVKFELETQVGWMLLEIAHIIIDGFAGNRPLTFKKNKLYDPDVKDFTEPNLIELMNALKTQNEKLWNLEDVRRNKSMLDEVRLEACDDVSVENKKRNDLIDKIDAHVDRCIKLAALSNLETVNAKS